jgi:hypothetical protein
VVLKELKVYKVLAVLMELRVFKVFKAVKEFRVFKDWLEEETQAPLAL